MNSTEYFFLFLGFRSVRRHIPLGRTSVLFHICRTRFVAVYSCLRRRILLARRSQLLRNPHEILRVFRWLAFLHQFLSVGVASRRRLFGFDCHAINVIRVAWIRLCYVVVRTSLALFALLGKIVPLSTSFAGFFPRWPWFTARFVFSSTITAGFVCCTMLGVIFLVVLSTCFDLFLPLCSSA